MRSQKIIKISGGGIAGLTAAIKLKKSGLQPIIFEKESTIGHNRNGDYEGLENWIFSKPMDTFFNQVGFNFKNLNSYPIFNFMIHSKTISPINISNKTPFFYMVKRGSNSQDLDTQLYNQCNDIGVKFKFERKGPKSSQIIATGTKKAAAYINGVNFKTDLKNQVHLLLGNEFAPKGYAYLIILNGQGTLATAFKKQKSNNNNILQNCIDYFQTIGVKINSGNRFGSRGSFSLPFGSFRQPYRIGEAGGYQDYLFGFGIRMSMMSGLASALSILGKKEEASLLMKNLNKKRRLSFLNRILYERLNDSNLSSFAMKLSKVDNPLSILSNAYKWNFKNLNRWIELKSQDEVHFT